MRICLIGDFSEKLDEGYKNTSHYLACGLESGNEVIRLNGKRVGSPEFWLRFVTTRPQIIHIIAQPTMRSLIFSRLAGLYYPNARIVISALRSERFFPNDEVGQVPRAIIAIGRPHLVLAQGAKASSLFEEAGCRAAILPNGVDLVRFEPSTPERKVALRLAYRLNPQQTTLLHVGHLRDERNLLALEPLVKAGMQVVVVGSLYTGINTRLIGQLKEAGLQVLSGYYPGVEQFYQLADCYIFPVQPGHSLSLPLSVLEAMACDLPVVATRFNAVQEAFGEGEGIYFVDSKDEIVPRVTQALAEREAYSTRSLVEEYSWNAVTNQLAEYYEELISA